MQNNIKYETISTDIHVFYKDNIKIGVMIDGVFKKKNGVELTEDDFKQIKV